MRRWTVHAAAEPCASPERSHRALRSCAAPAPRRARSARTAAESAAHAVHDHGHAGFPASEHDCGGHGDLGGRQRRRVRSVTAEIPGQQTESTSPLRAEHLAPHGRSSPGPAPPRRPGRPGSASTRRLGRPIRHRTPRAPADPQPAREVTSAATAPCPPESPTIADPLALRACGEHKYRARSTSSAGVAPGPRPHARQAASTTSKEDVSAPVCDCAASARPRRPPRQHHYRLVGLGQPGDRRTSSRPSRSSPVHRPTTVVTRVRPAVDHFLQRQSAWRPTETNRETPMPDAAASPASSSPT